MGICHLLVLFIQCYYQSFPPRLRLSQWRNAVYLRRLRFYLELWSAYSVASSWCSTRSCIRGKSERCGPASQLYKITHPLIQTLTAQSRPPRTKDEKSVRSGWLKRLDSARGLGERAVKVPASPRMIHLDYTHGIILTPKTFGLIPCMSVLMSQGSGLLRRVFLMMRL